MAFQTNLPQNHADAPPGAKPTACPFADLGDSARGDLASGIHDFGRNLYVIAEDTKDNSHDPLLERCFGSANLHPSLFVETERFTEGKKQKPPNLMPQYARLIGDLHNIFRFEIFKHLDTQLDTDRLSPETGALISDTKKLIMDYRATVTTEGKREGGLPLWSAVPEGKIREYEKQADTLIERFKQSELNDPSAQIPLRIEGAEQTLPNTDRLGMFLFALQMGGRQQLNDGSKAPRNLLKYFAEQATTVSSVPIRISRVLGHDERLQHQHDIAYAAAREHAQNLLRENAHAFQLANLFSEELAVASSLAHEKHGIDLATSRKLSAAYEGALAYADLPPYPQQFESPLECALAIRTLLRSKEGKKHAAELQPVFEQCLKVADKEQRVVLPEDAARAEAALKELVETTAPKLPPRFLRKFTPKSTIGVMICSRFNKDTPPLTVQAALAADYLEHQLGVGTAHSAGNGAPSGCPYHGH